MSTQAPPTDGPGDMPAPQTEAPAGPDRIVARSLPPVTAGLAVVYLVVGLADVVIGGHAVLSRRPGSPP